VAESIVTLRVEARNAISSLNKTSQATKTLSKSANGATASLTAASTAAKGLGASLAASLGPLLTVSAAVATVGNAIGTFTARERDVEILRQGLVNLGEGTAALNELQVAADRLGNQTLFNQEEFTRGFNLLTSFRNIGVDSYSRVAQAAADIAQVNQVDVSTSFMQLAKALQDPERNLSNLNRSGIAFTKQQTEVIKELMKTNKTAEAHAMILSIVEESYNKLAQAAAEGFAGNVDSLGEAFRDFSETLGKTLEPVLILTVKGLTSLIKAVDDLFRSPLGQTAGIFSAIALAAKGASVLLPLVAAGLQKVAFAGGAATIALNALPLVAVASALGFVITKLIEHNRKQKKFNELVEKGGKEQLKAAMKTLLAERARVVAQRRGTGLQQEKIKNIDAELKTLEDVLRTNILNTAELEKAEEQTKKNEEAAKKLKDAMTAVGEEIESSIKNNLRDAITGAQTFGQAMTNVLNRIRDKIIDAQIDKLIGGFGENFGKSASSGGGKGVGGFLGGLLGGLFRQNGGPVKAGQPYIVGERQPELFVPRTSGTILPSVPTGGGGTTNNMITVNVDATGSSVQGNGSEADQLGGLIASVVQATIIDEQRAGGLLNR
tara:strand:+ start:2873 stop:4693 length:1821 start_codon:yes stop_codon:yes gene_type:complete